MPPFSSHWLQCPFTEYSKPLCTIEVLCNSPPRKPLSPPSVLISQIQPDVELPILYFNCTSTTSCHIVMLEMIFPNDPEKVSFFTKFSFTTQFYIWLLFAIKTKFSNQSHFLSDSLLPAVQSPFFCSSSLCSSPPPLFCGLCQQCSRRNFWKEAKIGFRSFLFNTHWPLKTRFCLSFGLLSQHCVIPMVMLMDFSLPRRVTHKVFISTLILKEKLSDANNTHMTDVVKTQTNS